MVMLLWLNAGMAVKTYTEQLESVQATIERIETYGQATTYSGGISQTLTEANLNDLYNRETRLRRAVSRESNGGMRIRRGVPLG